MIILIIILIIFLIAVSIFFIYNHKKQNNKSTTIIRENKNDLYIESNNNFPNIKIIENNAIVPSEKNKIKDDSVKKAISTLENNAAKGFLASKSIRQVQNLSSQDKAFFSASKVGTEKMLGVKNSDKVYGIQVNKNGKFAHNTKFTKEDELINSVKSSELINAGFNITSMVVGQYYMNEINNKLESLEHNINKVQDFLDSEYQGKIERIVSKLKEVIDNKNEILCNEQLMKNYYDEILKLENLSTELLGQANDEISNNITNQSISYKEYEKNLKEIHTWFNRQNILQYLLLEIGDLRYVLANGNEKSILSHTQYNNYLNQTNKVNDELEKYNNSMIEKFGIDINELRRNGNFHSLRKNTIGKIKEELAYDKVKEDTKFMIEQQTSAKQLKPFVNNKKDEEIKIQKYNGEYYSLLK